MAPEIHRMEPYVGSQADIFSAGVMLYIFCAAAPPFRKAHKGDDKWSKYFLQNKVKEFWIDRQKRVGLNIPNSLKHLISSMLHPIGSKRPTVDQILAHPWLKEKIASKQDVINDMTNNRQHIVDHVLKEEADAKAHEKQEKENKKQAIEQQAGLVFDKDLHEKVTEYVDEQVPFDLISLPKENFDAHCHSSHSSSKPATCYHAGGDIKGFFSNVLYACKKVDATCNINDFRKSWKM